ncbi:FCS-Like Zinc finger 18 [Linum perenne]
MSTVQLQPRNSKNSTSTVLNNVVGLQTLLLLDSSSSSAAAVLNNVVLATKSFTTTPQSSYSDDRLAVLQYCNLCSSKLSPNKDVYMYRGDQGFCSTKCRDRQIRFDQVKQLHHERLTESFYYSSNRNSPLFEIDSSSSSSRSISRHCPKPRCNNNRSSALPRNQLLRPLYYKHS